MDNTLFLARTRLDSLKKDREIYFKMRTILGDSYSYIRVESKSKSSFSEVENLIEKEISRLHNAIDSLENDIYITETLTELKTL
jgi:hypothetical protein